MVKKKIEEYVYNLDEQLGSGAFGTVYKGTNQKTKQVVAIKVISKDIVKNQYLMNALHQEIKIMSKIHSINTVTLKNFYETGRSYYIIMQYCNNGDLHSLIAKQKKIPENEAINYMTQILNGFYQLIKKGIIHRDLKPENVLINDKMLKIADFGLSKQSSQNNYFQSVVGTPVYQAPQLLNCQNYNYKVDVWALGLIFYEMLYGTLPWKVGANLKQYHQTIKSNKISFPEDVQVSAQCKKLIAKCLQFKQEDRADWQTIYTHVIFKGKLPKYQNLRQSFNYAIVELRRQIHKNNLDLERFFKNLNLNEKSSIDKKQFYQLMKKMCPDMHTDQFHYIFSQFDEDKNGTVDFQEFKKCLEQAQIRTQSIHQQKLKMILGVAIEDEVSKAFIVEQERLKQLTQKFKLLMEKKQMNDLYQWFVEADLDKSGSISADQLHKSLLKLDPTIKKDDSQLLFNKFDENGDGSLSFKEFFRNMCYLTGTPVMGQSMKLSQ